MNDDDGLVTDEQRIFREQVAALAQRERMVSLGMRALALDAMKWAAFLGAFVLFGAAVWWPSWGRLAAAGAFALVVYVPMVWVKGRKA
jgi:hypothetical protein